MLGAPCPACTQVCTLIYMCNLRTFSKQHTCMHLNPVQAKSSSVEGTQCRKYIPSIPLHVLCVNVLCRLWKESQVL